MYWCFFTTEGLVLVTNYLIMMWRRKSKTKTNHITIENCGSLNVRTIWDLKNTFHIRELSQSEWEILSTCARADLTSLTLMSWEATAECGIIWRATGGIPLCLTDSCSTWHSSPIEQQQNSRSPAGTHAAASCADQLFTTTPQLDRHFVDGLWNNSVTDWETSSTRTVKLWHLTKGELLMLMQL